MRRENILGYPVVAEPPDKCLDQVVDWLSAGVRRHFFACANPHSLVVADADPAFREALQSAHLLTPDGVGILLGSRIMGGEIRSRVTGSDIFQGLSLRLNERSDRQYSYFFLGASEETLKQIEIKLGFPDFTVGGWSEAPLAD